MSLRLTTTTALSKRNAALLQDGYEFVARNGYVPNCFITARWCATRFADEPFRGLQKVLERLRKLDRAGLCIYFWCRERESANATEHAHIVWLNRSIKLKCLEGAICRWVGSEKGSGGIDIRPCGKLPACNARTLITGYLLKGLPKELRDQSVMGAQRRWSKPQGVIVGKRVGVSRDVSRGIRTLRLTLDCD